MPGGDGAEPLGNVRRAGGRSRRGAGQQYIAGPGGFCVNPVVAKNISGA